MTSRRLVLAVPLAFSLYEIVLWHEMEEEYEVEGMQAEGGSLYYCLAPATDGSKFPQYIVSVDR